MIEKKYGLGIRNDLEIEINNSFKKKMEKPELIVSKKSKGNFFVKKELTKEMNEEKDVLVQTINEKSEKTTITIPKNSKCSIHLKTKFLKKTKNYSFNMQIIVEENSECIINNEIQGKSQFVLGLIKIMCEAGSKTTYAESINLDKSSTYYSLKKSKIQQNAELTILQADLAGKKIYHEIKNNLEGEKSSSNIKHLFLGKGCIIDAHLGSLHNNKNTSSDILSKGILKQGESYIRGLVKINENAYNSDGYQKSDVLILDDSKAISIPDLEIHNNEVKCSHGSTITKLDEAKVFYMQSRGLSAEQAEQELIQGFFNDVFQTINITDINKLINKKILELRS